MRAVFASFCFLICQLQAEDSFFDWGWQMFDYEAAPFDCSPNTFGGGSSAKLSSIIVAPESAEAADEMGLPEEGVYGNGWPVGTSLNPNAYLEFSITRQSNEPVFVGYVILPLFAEVQGPQKWVLRWNVDAFSSDLSAPLEVDSTQNIFAVHQLDLWEHGGIDQDIVFRLYGFDSVSPTAYGGIVGESHKLFVRGGTRAPWVDIDPDVFLITTNPPEFSSYRRYYVNFIGSYDKWYALEKSDDSKIWVPADVPHRRILDINNLGSFRVSRPTFVAPKQVEFFRVVEVPSGSSE